MFKKYPYWGWLIIGIVLWCITGYRYYAAQRQLQPINMAHTIGKDLAERKNAFTSFLNDKKLLNNIFTDSLAESDATSLEKYPFYIFAYTNDSLVYWNTNEALVDCVATDKSRDLLLRNQKGVFIQTCVSLNTANSKRKLTVLFPIVITYPRENEYLRSHFLADDDIPVSTQILTVPAVGSIPVYTTRGNPDFHIIINEDDIQQHVPETTIIALIIISLIVSISWIHLMMIELAKKKGGVIGFAATVGIIIVLRGLTYLLGLPFGLRNIKLFSPILFATSGFLPSLGDLLLNIVCLLWIVVFLIRHLNYKSPLVSVSKVKRKQLVAFFIIALLTAYSYGFVNTIQALVLDSNISFDVSHFYSINVYTIFGLFIIALITAISCIIIYVLNIQLNFYIDNKWAKYLLIAIVGICFSIPGIQQHNRFYIFLSAWLFLFIVLLDIRRFSLVSDLFAPHMIFWAAFVCLFCTAMLQHFNHKKERAARQVYAEQHVMPERDPVTENVFSKTVRKIQGDKLIYLFFSKPSAPTRKLLNEHIDATYLGGDLNRYQAKVYFFNTKRQNIFNKDTLSFRQLSDEVKDAIQTITPGLYYKSTSDKPYDYLAFLPIYDSTQERLGYIYITLVEKKAHSETVNLELLHTTTVEQDFPHAIYENGKITAHTNDYPFPDYIKQNSFPSGEYVYNNTNNASELWFSYKDKRTIVVVHNHNMLIETITLFSYLFGIEILMAVILLVYQFCISYIIGTATNKTLRLTLRKRIHLAMLLVVLLSFFIIGIVTIAFFSNQYKSNNKAKLESAMQAVQEAVQQELRQNRGMISEAIFDSVSHANKFKYFITTLAKDQVIDINIFSLGGKMEVASQEEIYDRELLARLMRPEAYYQLNNLNRSLLIQDEMIGNLSYLSCYVPLHDQDGTQFGYVNVLNLSSEKELNFQISNIVVTLINLYAFIFLISGIITVLISRWLTGSLSVIIQQFGRLNLQQSNERIEWPYEDEIGMLVKEYNHMVDTLEENAALLAQSERESAWREMARQVAHEIKNPLTPMRLNIQHLQQALRNDHPEAKALAQRVSDSLIEQIDNLSYIASEFSNFAKMPEARPEELDVNAVIDSAVELYLNEQDTMVTLNTYHEPIWIYSDKSQLMRVVTNLLENARQAIPPGRIGFIEVTVTKKDDFAMISVADNGEGISAEARRKIFQPYFTTKSSGTGLGLTMTKKIIEFWKGIIWFETTEGKGTTFFIQIPLLNKAE